MIQKRLFIGSLPFTTTEGEILRLFVQEGMVVDVTLMLDDRRRSKGMGFVEYASADDALRAKTKFHNYKLNDRTIIVDFAKEDPLKTEEGQQKFNEALTRRGPRFSRFDRKLEKKQFKKHGTGNKKKR